MIKFFLPMIAGFSIVLQGALNRNSTTHMGLISVALLNAIIFLFFSLGIWLLIKLNIIMGSENAAVNPFTHLQWWQILPGILGYLIVCATPLAIEYLGANSTFAIIICTQLLVSLAWDAIYEKTAPTIMSIIGILIMMGGLAVLLSGKK
ncbi:MAG: DMT family transporter [Pseudobdellovibrionaceae bacterium]